MSTVKILVEFEIDLEEQQLDSRVAACHALSGVFDRLPEDEQIFLTYYYWGADDEYGRTPRKRDR